jgi:hypothetical protein
MSVSLYARLCRFLDIKVCRQLASRILICPSNPVIVKQSCLRQGVSLKLMRLVNNFSSNLRVGMGHYFAHWQGDLTGGLTAAVVALPLALAFAVASGVDPKAGLSI